jgi:phosphohistidine phosphatase SixA
LIRFRLLALALCGASLFAILPPVAAQPPDCEFTLGFAAMRDLLGATTVGNCVENERFLAGNGNSEQRTTNGVLSFSALDGFVRFRDRDLTWIVGPEGLVQRPNNVRFEWEGDRILIETIREGGHFIFFRHGPTIQTQTDARPPNLPDCTTQRNLTDTGRDQASVTGQQFRAMQIPVGTVLSSPYCRAHEYAYLLFGRVTRIEPSMQIPDNIPADAAQRNSATMEMLFTPPAPGTNTVMVAHSPNIRDIFGYGLATDLPVEGGAVILRPEPGSRPAIVARVLPTEWPVFAEALAVN